MRATAVRHLVAALWAGSLWAIGFLAAPAVFASADSTQAGNIVSMLLTREAWLSIACMLLLLVLVRGASDLDARRKRLLNVLVVIALVLTLVNYFGLQALMAQLRAAAGPGGVRASPQWTEFAVLHGVSQLLYVIQSVLAAVVVVKNR
jgi:predicted neutral ceramidase superfamily lipid hydrolase